MNKFSSVWVFSDTPSRLPELMSGAQAVGEKVNAFVLNEADSATACHLGADHVWLLSGKPEDRMIEDYAAAMAETIRQHSEGGAVLLPNTRRGKLLAAKLGYRLSAAVSNDASDVSLQDGKAAVKHMVYGGLAIGAETIASPFAVITLSSGTFDAQQPDASRSGEMHTVQWQAPATAVTRTATQRVRATALTSTKRVWWSAWDAASAAKRISRWPKRCARRLAPSWPVPARWRKTRSGWSTSATSVSPT